MPLGALGLIPSSPFLAWNRRQLALVSGLALLTAGALVPAVWIVRELFDTWIPTGNSRAALIGCIGLFAIRAATAGLTVLQRQAGMRLAKEATAKLRIAVARRILEVDPRVLDTLDNSRVQTRIVKGTERIDVMLNRLTSVVIPAASTAIIAATGMVLISPVLSAVEVAVVAIVLLAHRRHSTRVRRSVLGFQDAFESYAASTAFLIRHAELIRTRGFEDGELRRQESVVERLRDRSNDMANAHVQNGQIQSVLVGWMAIAALIVGGQQVIAGHSTVGTLAAFYFAAALGAQALLQIVSARSDLMSGRVAMDRLTELWTLLKPATAMGAGTASTAGAAKIELRNVYVDYDDRTILRGLDLTLQPGEHISVSGPNGAGKTTLLRVLLGLLPPRSGQVLVDGHDLEDLNVSDVRKRIGLAPQRPTFFGGTIAENITYGRPEAGPEDIRWTLEIVGLASLVDTLPVGMHSAMGDEGVRLSGGEAQRASIARALIGRPELLVLDEPGNHLTAVDLAEILGAIRRALPRATIVTVGHDDSCARMADRALMLHDGALADSMSADKLLAE
jgi:ABC-type multidrug transport system fused ATPase/permease subunit